MFLEKSSNVEKNEEKPCSSISLKITETYPGFAY